MNTEQDYLTKEKFEELEKELETLKTIKRKEIAEALEYAKSLGDLSENQEYQEARDSQAILEDRISRIGNVLKSAKVISTQNANFVTIGSVVTVEKEKSKLRISYTMTGSEEADVAQGKISIHSPLGLSAIGKAKGDTFSFDTPNGKMLYKIISIK